MAETGACQRTGMVSGNWIPDKATPTVVKNLQYWFSNSNDGFHLAYGTHHFDGEKKFSYEKRNGFTIAWKSSGEVKPAAAKVASR